MQGSLIADSDSHEAPTFSPIEEAQVTADCFAWEMRDVMKKNESNVNVFFFTLDALDTHRCWVLHNAGADFLTTF